jgi:uncharacterized membrane protein
MKTKSVIGGFAAGVAAMYFADRRCGARRRALARDGAAAKLHRLRTGMSKLQRDTANRAGGLLTDLRNAFRGDENVSDSILLERVRSQIGRASTHPHAISVRVEPGGRVILTGPILVCEVNRVVKAVGRVRGVKQVLNRLELHNDHDRTPDLQGGRVRRQRGLLGQNRWTPAERAGASVLGGTALATGMRTGGLAGFLTGAAGAALLTRALANRGLNRVFGIGSNTEGIHIDKSICIYAPVESVYAFWENFENFPRFMSHLKEVRNIGNGHSRWVAEGPFGMPAVWEAEITAQERNSRLAWKSVPGSRVRTCGEVKFTREPDGATRVDIRMSYMPPAGVFGHALASLFGADPKSEMTDDLMRLKSLMEIGKTRAHGRAVTFDEVAR